MNRNSIILVIVAIVLVAGAYFFWGSNNVTAPASQTSPGGAQVAGNTSDNPDEVAATILAGSSADAVTPLDSDTTLTQSDESVASQADSSFDASNF